VLLNTKMNPSVICLTLCLSSFLVSGFTPAAQNARLGTFVRNVNDSRVSSASSQPASRSALSAWGTGFMTKRKQRKANAAAKSDVQIDEAGVRALFSLWNNALKTGDSRIVASRYTVDPVLLPTVSDVPRTNYDSVKDYFDAFLLKKPQGEILSGSVKIGDGWASDSGIYEFTMGVSESATVQS
jgi:hypothetical protein